MLFKGSVAGLAVLLVGAACATGINYTDGPGPRYAGEIGVPASVKIARAPDSLRLVTFNIQFARHVDQAIALLQSAEPLLHADVITLQEMDAPGTARIAQALGMSYVYYPATVHPATHRDFGDAILSRWPIIADEKIILPHLGRIQKTQRIATAVTILVGDLPVRVYSMHLGTWVDVSGDGKRDQVRAVLADAANFPRVIVAGDANSHGIGESFRAAGYGWPSEHNTATTHVFNWDHVFLKGLASAGSGVIHDNLGASDHRPVWALIRLRAPQAEEALSVIRRD